jgi:hypothetical protein
VRAAAVEALEDPGVEPTVCGFDRRPRCAEADDDDVGFVVPGDRIGPRSVQWCPCRLGSLLRIDTVAQILLVGAAVGQRTSAL